MIELRILVRKDLPPEDNEVLQYRKLSWWGKWTRWKNVEKVYE